MGLVTSVDQCLDSLNAPMSITRQRRDELLAKRHENTCSWFFKDPRYQEWIFDDKNVLLWILGNPGSGKSVLAALLTHEIAGLGHSRTPLNNEKLSVSYFFCDSTNELLRTDTAILKCLLAQILDKNRSTAMFEYFQNEFNNERNKNIQWTTSMLWRVFEQILIDDSFKNTCLIIDTLGTYFQNSMQLYCLTDKY